jgi:hypothetical protein
MEKEPTIEDRYNLLHQRIAERLGDAYNQEKIDAIAGAIGFDKVEEELKTIESYTDPVENARRINEWYVSHKDILDMFRK